jgi:hypothetical protein
VLLHYNPACTHRDSPVTPLRLLYVSDRYDEALHEISRLNALPLEAPQRLVVNVHEALIRLSMRTVTYGQAKSRLKELAGHIRRLGDEDFIAEFRSRRIGVASRYSDHEQATHLMYTFFDDILRTPVTEAHWRIAHGTNALWVKGPAAAIPFYLTAVMQLRVTDRPCLREMAARRLASCLRAMGDKDGAVSALRNIGLPASIEPKPDEIALADLLTLSFM